MASVSVGFLVKFPGTTLFFVMGVFFINFDLSHRLRHLATFVCQYGYLADSLTISRCIAFYLFIWKQIMITFCWLIKLFNKQFEILERTFSLFFDIIIIIITHSYAMSVANLNQLRNPGLYIFSIFLFSDSWRLMLYVMSIMQDYVTKILKHK